MTKTVDEIPFGDDRKIPPPLTVAERAALLANGTGPEANHPGDAAPTAYGATQSALGGSLPPPPPLVYSPADVFMDEEEDTAAPLLGLPDDMLLSFGGILFMYGRGGAGKTTLTLDAIAHLASGTTWLGQTVAVPLKILMIENEGVRALLRQRLRAKRDTWQGEPWTHNLQVMVDPWMAFSFKHEEHRQQLADWITEFEADLVVVGPLVTIGSTGGGTPEEVYAFEILLLDTRRRTPLEPAFWILHHENKQKDISGAWDRVPDATLHVTGQGNGHTQIHFEKARNSSLHDTKINLTWTAGFGYSLDTPPEPDNDVLTRVRELFETEDRIRSSGEVRVAVSGGKNPVDRALKTLAETGYLTMRKGKELPDHGYAWNASCYCHDSALLAQTLDSGLDTELDSAPVQPSPASPANHAAGNGRERWTAEPPPEGCSAESSVSDPPTANEEANPDDDIPF